LRKIFEGKTKTKVVAEREEEEEKGKKRRRSNFFGAKKRACTDHGKIASVSSGAGLLLSRESSYQEARHRGPFDRLRIVLLIQLDFHLPYITKLFSFGES
jgi:hypothetical protein